MPAPTLPLFSLDQLLLVKQNFLAELQASKQGQSTSLAYVQNPFPQNLPLKLGQTFQVMVIGGRIFKTALARRSESGISLEQLTQDTLPTLDTKEIFFNFFTAHLNERVDHVALNFAYPLQPVANGSYLDGTLFKGTKEHAFAGLIGQLVGRELIEAVQATLGRTIHLSLANDTVCLVLSGTDRHATERLVGGVVGTGINFGFFADQNTIINLESANFNRASQTPTGKLIDQESLTPGNALFEKEVSGAYLYKHYNLTVGTQGEHIADSDSLSQLATDTNHPFHDLAQYLLNRSASLVACQVAGIYEFKRQPHLTFVMEGSLFWNGWHYHQTVEDYVVKLGVASDAVDFLHIDHSGLVGAAHLLV